jgi:hypothetical protein
MDRPIGDPGRRRAQRPPIVRATAFLADPKTGRGILTADKTVLQRFVALKGK